MRKSNHLNGNNQRYFREKKSLILMHLRSCSGGKGFLNVDFSTLKIQHVLFFGFLEYLGKLVPRYKTSNSGRSELWRGTDQERPRLGYYWALSFVKNSKIFWCASPKSNSFSPSSIYPLSISAKCIITLLPEYLSMR